MVVSPTLSRPCDMTLSPTLLWQDEDLLERLRGAPLIALDEDATDASAARLRYRPKNEQVRDRASLLNFVRDHPQGVWRDEVDDCYKGEACIVCVCRACGRTRWTTAARVGRAACVCLQGMWRDEVDDCYKGEACSCSG